MPRILLGVTGGIAAYKAVEFARLAIKAGHSVRAVQTESSLNFVGRSTLEGITGAPVMVSQFETDPAGGVFADQARPDHDPISHLALAENCDLYVIAPASANTIAKLAGGFADNMLSALALAAEGKLLIAPAMNNAMYTNPATQANLQALRDRGAVVVEPTIGELASKGEYGVGRLVEPVDLLAAAEAQLNSAGERFAPQSLDGLKLLITAGGTREPIDSVRFVGNRSSGKMGMAIAEEAAARGASVTVIAVNVSLPRSQAVEYVDVGTAAELETAVNEHFPASDALVMTAAVADFRPADPVDDKLKKSGKAEISLQLVATPDILAGVAANRRDDQLIVGFAAEHGSDLAGEAQRKLEQKGLDLVVANDISNPEIGFESDLNEVTIFSRDGREIRPPRGSKREVAVAILDCLARVRAEHADVGSQ